MANYVVTGAMVQVRGAAADGSSALVYVYRGGVVDLDAEQAKHLTSVGLVEKVADVDNDPIANPPVAVVPQVSVLPSKGDDKSVWEAHAVRSGLSQDDAEKASKEDLVAIFGGDGLPQADPEPAAAPKRTVTRK